MPEAPSGSLLYLIGLNCAGHIYGTAKKQKLFSEGGFSGIGVTHYGEGPSSLYFFG